MWRSWVNGNSWWISEDYIRVVTLTCEASPWTVISLLLGKRNRPIGATLCSFDSRKSAVFIISRFENSWLNIMSFCETAYTSVFYFSLPGQTIIFPHRRHIQVEDSQIFDFIKIMWVTILHSIYLAHFFSMS